MRTIYCILAVSSALASTVSSQTLHVLSIGWSQSARFIPATTRMRGMPRTWRGRWDFRRIVGPAK